MAAGLHSTADVVTTMPKLRSILSALGVLAVMLAGCAWVLWVTSID